MTTNKPLRPSWVLDVIKENVTQYHELTKFIKHVKNPNASLPRIIVKVNENDQDAEFEFVPNYLTLLAALEKEQKKLLVAITKAGFRPN